MVEAVARFIKLYFQEFNGGKNSRVLIRLYIKDLKSFILTNKCDNEWMDVDMYVSFNLRYHIKLFKKNDPVKVRFMFSHKYKDFQLLNISIYN